MIYITKKHYKQIDFEERIKKQLLNECLESISKIAKRLKKTKFTIKQEVEMNLIKGKYTVQKDNDISLKNVLSPNIGHPLKIIRSFQICF